MMCRSLLPKPKTKTMIATHTSTFQQNTLQNIGMTIGMLAAVADISTSFSRW